MKKVVFVLLVASISATSCLDNFSDRAKSQSSGQIPADFDWKTTQDVSIAVAAPLVGGTTQDANVRIFSSPILYPENIVATGVTSAAQPFNTSFTMPAGAKNLYVQTSLPDGTTSVKMISATASASVQGAEMPKLAPKFASRAKPGAEALVETAMPNYPKATLKSETDFDSQAIMRTEGFGQLGANWSTYAAAEYLIPVGAEITSGIDLTGGFSPYNTPVLYVAGKLTISSLSIGQAQLVVLPGGEVTVSTLTAQDRLGTDKASLFIFEGGKVTTSKPNLSCKYVVNEGEFVVNGDLDFNNAVIFCNGTTGKLTVEDQLKVSNKVKFYNDGQITTDDLFSNSNGEFYNFENGNLKVEEVCEFESQTTIFQRGIASFHEMKARGTIYVNCYTTVGFLEAQNGTIHIAAGVTLEAEDAMFNNTNVSVGAGSLFAVDEYNIEKKGGKTTFKYVSQTDLPAVVHIEEKGYSDKGHETHFDGNIEVVYDDTNYSGSVSEEYLVNGAVMRKKQTVVLESSVCNGDKEPVTPDPDPLPENDYKLEEGGVYTYCFEDQWPWLGDYDMNDVVLETRIDRVVSKDRRLAKSITINWSLKAAGAQYELACGLQLDEVLASEVANVTSTHKIGSGAFETDGLEAGNVLAVIPFFNNLQELLSAANTYKGHPHVEPQQHSTTITFAQPIEVDKVKESVMNVFITARSREQEIHLSGFQPTNFGVIGEGAFLRESPYRFFVDQGPHRGNNYMMWGLVIPGEFSYPAEGKSNDIRGVYEYFSDWAVSGGAQHETWYREEANKAKLY